MELVEKQVRIDITPAIADVAWRETQGIAAAGNRWQAYLNQLCLQTVRPWLQEKFQAQTVVKPQHTCFPGIWELVNGFALELSGSPGSAQRTLRIVFLPAEAMDRSELRVPREWIDLPQWAGDYYVATEMDVEGQWIELWGYATHVAIKTQGMSVEGDRSYSLEAHHLIPDLNVLWVVHQLGAEPTQAAIAPISPLPPDQQTALVQQLGDRAIVLPRLEVPFEQWAALLTSDGALQQLCRARQGSPEINGPVQLGRWWQQLVDSVDDGWRAVESLLGNEALPAYGFRQAQPLQERVQRVKSFSLNSGVILRLLMTLATEMDGRMVVQVQLLPNVGVAYLPENLQLSLLSSTDQVLQSVQSRDQDNLIQLQQFRCVGGTRFRVQVVAENSAASEAEPPQASSTAAPVDIWIESFLV